MNSALKCNFLLLIMMTWSHQNVKFLLYRWFFKNVFGRERFLSQVDHTMDWMKISCPKANKCSWVGGQENYEHIYAEVNSFNCLSCLEPHTWLFWEKLKACLLGGNKRKLLGKKSSVLSSSYVIAVNSKEMCVSLWNLSRHWLVRDKIRRSSYEWSYRGNAIQPKSRLSR